MSKQLLLAMLLTAGGVFPAVAFDPAMLVSGLADTESVQIGLTIPQRLERIRKALAQAEKQLADLENSRGEMKEQDFRNWSKWLNSKANLRKQQIRELETQQEKGKAVDAALLKQYDPEATADFRRKIADYTRRRTDWGYNQSDIIFSGEVIELLKSGKIDPNVEVTDSSYPEYSGPLARAIQSGRIQRAPEILQVLTELNADFSRVPLQVRGQTVSTAFRLHMLESGLTDIDGPGGNYLLGELSRPVHEVDLKIVRKLLMSGCELEVRDVQRRTPLHYVAKLGNPDLLTLFLLAGADVNAVDFQGETPLFHAVRSGNKRVEALLIAGGCDPDALNHAGVKAEAMAVQGNFVRAFTDENLTAAKRLSQISAALAKEADPNMLLPDGKTPLQYACLKKDHALLKLLLENGANPNASLRNAYSNPVPLRITFDARDIDSFKLLLKYKADPDTQIHHDGTGGSLLKAACEQKKFIPDAFIIALLEAGADLHAAPQHFNYTPLDRALASGKPAKTVQLLLDRIESLEGPTYAPILHTAIQARVSPEMLETLHRKGAKIDGRTHFHDEAIHAAAETNNRAALDLLLTWGADVNASGQMGKTPLMAAAGKGNTEMMEYLLGKGADPKLTDRSGKTAQDCLEQRQRQRN